MSRTEVAWESYRRGWQQRKAEAVRVLESRRERAMEAAGRCAHVLLHEFGANAVYGFGSMFEGPIHDGSDLDLAVEGLAPALHFKAYARVCAECSDELRVDLVPMETISDTFRERIRTRGRRLDATAG